MTRLETLEPEFRKKVEVLVQVTEAATGRKWGLSDGRRTISRQDALYSQGRTTAGKVVTNAKGGQSPHNFGLAADLWPMTEDGDFDWGAKTETFKVMADKAKELGLVAGYYFKSIFDAPHVEDPDWKAIQLAWRRGEIEVA